MFNKDVAEEARKTFPANAFCQTVHALAHKYAYQSVNYGRPVPSLWVQTVCNHLGKAKHFLRYYARAKAVISTLTSYFESSDTELLSDHLPPFDHKEYDGPMCRWQFRILSDARNVFDAMKSPEASKIPMTHDGYLKVFQLMNPQFMEGFDILLVDEAQDLNPAMVQPILYQKCPKIFVGDPNQQIYAFRGAVNALEMITPTDTLFLTFSFRLSPDLGLFASCWMARKNGTKILVGCNDEAHLDGTRIPTHPLVIIARKNETLIDCCKSFPG